MSVLTDAGVIHPQSLMEFVNTPDGMIKSGDYFESQIVKRTVVIKEGEKDARV